MQKIRVLLAEDNHDHRQLLLLALGQGGPHFEVTATATGPGLLDAARTGAFDCIVLDYNIPPTNASELVPQLGAVQPDTPIIVVSSSAAQHVVIESLRTGVADFIPKDQAIDAPALASRIEQAVRDARQRASERRRIHRRLRHLEMHANTDPLTGLANRRGVERAITGRPLAGDRRGSVAIYLFDLDHFKRVNDTLGHHEGDRVLRAVSSILSEEAGGDTIAGRWGGEEFVAIRHEHDPASAWAWAERIRSRVEREVPLPFGGLAQTLSAGLDIVPTAEVGEAIMQRADRALYFAKDSGRNRVCTFDMVSIHERALDIGANTRMTPRARLLTLIDELRPALGATQLEHIGPHGARVRELAGRVGACLGLDTEQTEALDLAAEFHDIGKLAIPEAVLALPRRLTTDEQAFIAQHTWFGAQVLAACGGPPMAAGAIAHHHARFDGETPLDECHRRLARIITACDAYATMTSERCYAGVIGPRGALDELARQRGRQFDPDVVAALRSDGRRPTRAA